MATVGQVLTNKITGEKLKYLQTSEQTNGKLTRFELQVSPKGYMPIRHLHPSQSETVEVTAGVLKVECGGEIKYLKTGEKFTIDKGVPHQWWNESDLQSACAIFTIEPANKFQIMQEQIFGVCNEKGKLSFLQIMVMAKEYDMVVAGPPIFLQKIMRAVFAPIGRMIGLRKYYPEYSDTHYWLQQNL